MGVLRRSNIGSVLDTWGRSKTAPAGNRGLTSRWAIRQEALVSIPPQPCDTPRQAR